MQHLKILQLPERVPTIETYVLHGVKMRVGPTDKARWSKIQILFKHQHSLHDRTIYQHRLFVYASIAVYWISNEGHQRPGPRALEYQVRQYGLVLIHVHIDPT